MDEQNSGISAWFAGPKAENGEWFGGVIRRVLEDYYAWRRNYFPEDGVVVDSAHRRQNEPFQDAFEDRMLELLARLKGDFPFQSPRYAAHMLSEQTLPSIAGYFAAMLYNPNNVTSDCAPVTVRLELEASQMIARMLGYGTGSWAHLTSGGTLANVEALWMARSVLFLPRVVGEMRDSLGLAAETGLKLGLSPTLALESLSRCFSDAARALGDGPATTRRAIKAYLDSRYNVAERGLASVLGAAGMAEPVLLLPETHHYCFEKSLDLLGLGRRALVSVRVDPEFRMKVGDLAAKLDAADRDGRPVLGVIAVVGTTEEGAVDPVDQVLELRAARERAGKPSFWVHADGAYGGYLRTVTRPERIGLGAPRASVMIAGAVREIDLELPEHDACAALERMGECDSITIDPHKLGYIPYPAGAICFRSDIVKAIARQEAPYLEEGAGDVETERKAQGVGMYVLEGSKPGAAAASVWLSHALIPLDNSGHGRLIRDTIRNACELHALLTRMPELTPGLPVRCIPLCRPGSNIVCYTFRPTGRDVTLAEINAANRRVFHRFNLDPGERVYDQSFFVSRTTLSSRQYTPETVGAFLGRLGVCPESYLKEGVFLMRSVVMNPWCTPAKQRGRYFLSELAQELYRVAGEEFGAK